MTIPNYTTQLGNAYKGNIDAALAALGGFWVSQQSPPDMTAAVAAGNLHNVDSETFTVVAAQLTATIAAPSTNPRNDIVHIDETTGAVGVATGTEAASPTDPAVPAGKIPLARIALTTSTTTVTDSIITNLGPELVGWLKPDGDGSSLTGVGSQTDIRLLALMVAETAGDRLNMVDGIADPYADETDVDTATSTNETYDAAGDFYKPTTGGVSGEVLLHFNGSDGSTTFTNDGTDSMTFSASANAQIDTAQSKFGGASGLFDGTGDDIVGSAGLALGSGDFTIEGFVRLAANQTQTTLWSNRASGGADTTLVVHIGSTTNRIEVHTDNNIIIGSGDHSTDLVPGTWHHVTVCRSGSTLRLGIDGTIVASKTNSYNLSSTNVWRLGGNDQSGIGDLNGHLDEWRVDVGTAHYAGTYTVPSAPFAQPGNMTLVSNAFTADSAPATGRIHVQVKENEAITVNTDLTAEISRDGGTTWTTATLALKETLADGTKAYEDDDLDISGQPSGTSMKYRHKTLNNKDIEIHGTVGQWA